MTAHPRRRRIGDGGARAAVLSVFLVIQSLCAVFFIGDALSDLRGVGLDAHTALEATVAVVLVLGVIFGGLEMRRTLDRMRRAETALSAASGAFAELIGSYFDGWGLTPAEAEVALFALKGLDISEIAELRSSAPGTVRAQLTRVYAKAGVSNRSQLISLFIEDLLAEPIEQTPKRETAEGPQASIT